MTDSHLLVTLTASLAAALVLGFATHKLRLSPIVGYLVAGLLLGPYTPGFVADREMANELAEIGVVLMMFGVGLHFHLKDLIAIRHVAILGALCQSGVATLLGALASHAFGFTWSASIVFGLALSVASTVMLTRVLVDHDAVQTPAGRIAIGWLLVEDILAVVALVLLPALFSSDSAQVSTSRALAFTIVKLATLVALTFFVGKRGIPRLLEGIASTQSRELFTLAVLAIALGIALAAAVGFGVSMALGAFLAGMIVGQSEFSFRAASDALPMRDAFSVLFFVSVGMLLDPGSLMMSPLMLLLTLGIVLVGKPLVTFVLVRLFGYDFRISTGVAMALAQIGEFSLILATVADQLGIFPSGATNLVIATAIVSLTLNPLQYKMIKPLETALSRIPVLWRVLNSGPPSAADLGPERSGESSAFRAVVVGYGPIGQTVARLLREGGIEPIIVEANLETSRRARNDGHRVVYGSAGNADILEAADLRSAVALILSASASDQHADLIRTARKTNPAMRVIARSNYLRETVTLSAAGADAVFAGEGEVALAMTEDILRMLGATPEQVDRERQRVREDVFPDKARGT